MLSLYAKRALRWHSNSWPYISGDAMSDMADVVFRPPRGRGKSPTWGQVTRARVIYVNSIDLVEFLDLFGNRLEAKVILAGNSDTEFHEPLSFPKSIKRIFLQNSFISDGKRVFTLPIGIENYRLGLNGNPAYINNLQCVSSSNPKLMFGPFGNTHPIRNEIRSKFISSSGDWEFFDGHIKPQEFDQLCSKFSFVACPRGNGIDTHRLWETLYRGRIPIVAKDKWSDSLDILNLPIRKIRSWDRKDISDELEHSSLFNPEDLPQLWMPYWKQAVGGSF